MATWSFEPNEEGIRELMERIGRERGEAFAVAYNELRAQHHGQPVEDLVPLVRAAVEATGLGADADTIAGWAAGISADEPLVLTVNVS